MSDLPSRDICHYCIESRTVSPKMLGCLGHYPNNSAQHLVDREAIDYEAAERLIRTFTHILREIVDAAIGDDDE